MAITIIFAPPRYGKTVLMTHLLNTIMYDRERSREMWAEIEDKNNNGFSLTMPKHCVSANYDIKGKKFGYSPRFSYRINPFRLGYANKYVKTHFVAPYSAIGITEGQKYLNSRMSAWFPDWQSRWYEQHGHNYIDVFIDTQRPMLIDVNIRELSSFIEIIKLTKKYDNNGKIVGLEWLVRKIENSNLLDRYFASGKQDKACYTEETIMADYNVFECYNGRSCKPKHYEGHFDEDFDLQESEPVVESIVGYIDYLEKFDDEVPDKFYQKRSVA